MGYAEAVALQERMRIFVPVRAQIAAIELDSASVCADGGGGLIGSPRRISLRHQSFEKLDVHGDARLVVEPVAARALHDGCSATQRVTQELAKSMYQRVESVAGERVF